MIVRKNIKTTAYYLSIFFSWWLYNYTLKLFMCWIIIDCLSSCFSSCCEKKPPSARVELHGPHTVLDELELVIRKKLEADQLPISKFATKEGDLLTVTMYRKGKTYEVYNGSSTTDYQLISKRIEKKVRWYSGLKMLRNSMKPAFER